MIENNTNTPADEIASTTPAIAITGEPVTTQAPADTPEIDNTNTSAATLPVGYLVDGFMDTTPDGKQRFLKRDYVDRFAKELAAALATGTPALSAAAFRFTFLGGSRKLLRRDTPDGAKLTAAATMQVQAIKLVSQNKAPAILVDMIAKAVAAVTDAETFQSLHAHLDAVHIFMLQIERQKGGDL